MKNRVSIFVFALFMLFTTNALAEVQAIFNFKQFKAPNKGIYIENYLSFVSSSLRYKSPDSDKLQAKLLVTQILKKKDSIVDFKKYNVLGPVLKDSIAVDFKDQKRFYVTPGVYEIEIEIQDLNDSLKRSVSLSKFLTISPYDLETNLSDIELIDYFKKTEGKKNSFSKSGYDIYPMISSYIPSDVVKLAFYYEIYTEKVNQKVLVKEYIETYYGNKLMPSYINRSVKKLKEITPLIHAFDITKLSTGNYNLVVEIRDSNNQIITYKKVFIQRVNADVALSKDTAESESLTYGVSSDSLDYYLESLIPISNTLEYKVLIGNKDKLTDEQKETYFINFWQTRYGVNGITEWEKYKKLVAYVENRFGNKVKRGYMTDMGRVYLKYGPPNDIIEKQNQQGTYPYAIWHYYQTNNRSNVRFVFYHSTAVSQDFELIHSDMPGEITNNNWKYLVNMRVGGKDNRVDDDDRRMR